MLGESLLIVLQYVWEVISDPLFVGVMLAGSFIGILFGAIPGITATTAVVLLIPATYYLQLDLALIFLMAIFKGGMFGGSISGILIGTPGSPGAVATAIDGRKLGQEGKGRKATLAALFSSVFGDMTSDIITIILAPVIGMLAMKIGPPELFLIIILCSFTIGTMTGGNDISESRISRMSKAIISAGVGFVIVFIGIEPVFGTPRFNFGSVQLLSGFPLTPVFLGLFGMSVALQIMCKSGEDANLHKVHIPPPKDPSDAKFTFKEFKYCFRSILYGTVVGTIIGIAPGLGPNSAGLLAHTNGRFIVKEKDKLGKGSIEGVAIAESANSAVNGANLLPLVTIGIPGSTEAAVLMGAFLLHGIQLGPLLIIKHPEVIYKMFAGMLVASLGTLIIGYLFIPVFVRALRIPKNVLFPIVMLLCLIGAFSEQPRLMYMWIVIAFGVIGYIMDRIGLSVSALCIAFILGSYAESSLSQSLIMSRGNIVSILQRPAFIVISASIIAVVVLFTTMSRAKRHKHGNHIS